MPDPAQIFGPGTSILITGASSGIGATLARQLASHGGSLALVARREDRLQQLVQEVQGTGGKALAVAADVTDPAQVRQAYARIAQAHGAPQVAFLNAGLSDFVSLHRFDAGRIQRQFEVNVFGVLYWLEALLPHMIQSHSGIIAGTSSLAAARGLPGNPGYSATKAALSSMLDCIRPEAAQHGIQVTIIEPGFVKTEMTADARFPMPFLVGSEKAGRIIVDGVARGKSMIRFPWPTALGVKLLSHLPDALYDRLGRSMLRKKK